MDFTITACPETELDNMLAFRNQMFTPISRAFWEETKSVALIAMKNHTLLGVIPFQPRQFKINNKLHIPVVFENGVGVSEQARSQGIGTAIIHHAISHFQPEYDALFVFRGNEQSPAYRFYRKNEHSDLVYETILRMETSNIHAGHQRHLLYPEFTIHCLDWNETAVYINQMEILFHSMYGHYGGYQVRDQEYFSHAFSTHLYKNEDCKVLVVKKQGELKGYAITNPRWFHANGYAILEMAVESTSIVPILLDSIYEQAAEKNQSVVVTCNQEHPLYHLFLEYGFKFLKEDPYIMGYIIHPQRFFQKHIQDTPILQRTKFIVQTPLRTILLHEPTVQPNDDVVLNDVMLNEVVLNEVMLYEIVLYMKESLLTRWLTNRLDLQESIRMNMVRHTPMPAIILDALQSALPFNHWTIFGMDYV